MTLVPAATATAPRRPRQSAGLPAPAVLRAMPTDLRVHTLEACLRRELQLRLRVPPAHRVSGDRPLRRQGVHPLLALQLKRALEHALDVAVPADLLCEGTLGEVAETLAAGLGGGPEVHEGGSP
ncbi:acyl carrier protein [Streptomyces bicolor]|uniref:acyl carrier protein n=1 Tax=Streptomyces bicolor TaxID=66874 RepID=UPI0004E11EF6|nr:acyl carrier protein [Streptomyces bicolor]